MLLVAVSDLTKTYVVGQTGVPALRGVSLAIDSGEFVAVMGSSGSGKSTLMNLLGCLDTPSSGTYHLAGQNVLRLSTNKLAAVRNTSIGFVFQQFNLLTRATALENVELPMVYAGLGWRERRRRARNALAQVGLSDREHHRPSQLSGGQQQRVAIARALVNQPLLLLADEPTGALDSLTSHEIMTALVRLNEDGLTVMVVTHDAEIARYARRIIRFKDGRVVSDDLNQHIRAAA
ncbi:putative ABC transport system ATP-binding protein [Bradyrhizobium sp. CIR18]|uniref:ABC transporter ATP-binding protein n=1 Tax=Bradyrhizobium sp. CIR18 TaxID=2663839 RepID=UPI0018387B47|nr:ABC transporter ATP-binding protein [Bradyrhizobium sp. CIR18]MBB4363502.1 putative ABC transport system ATP-binding protein [Bradyrhizobium sp. CIR18]